MLDAAYTKKKKKKRLDAAKQLLCPKEADSWRKYNLKGRNTNSHVLMRRSSKADLQIKENWKSGFKICKFK